MWYRSIILFAALLTFGFGASATSPLSCWDGSITTDIANCPPKVEQVFDDYFGPKDRYVSVIGFRDKPLIVSYGKDDFQTKFVVWDYNQQDDISNLYLTYRPWQVENLSFQSEGIWLEIGNDPADKYSVSILPDGQHEIRNSGGARMLKLECVFNNVKSAADSNDEPYQEITLNCAN